jgi:hypothetical protein
MYVPFNGRGYALLPASVWAATLVGILGGLIGMLNVFGGA